MRILFLAFVAFVAAVNLADDAHHPRFQKFIATYNKQYSEEEYLARFETYKQNMAFIEMHNKVRAPKLGFTVAENQFADMSNEEFVATMNNYKSGLKQRMAIDTKLVRQNTTLPTTVDWREQGAVTPVKNQGQCGSCWAFSTTGSVEGAWKLAGNTLVSLSEQNLVDCSGAQGNDGCNGGLMDNGFAYIIANGGIDTEACYPYTAQDGTCSFKSSCIGAKISGHKDIPTGSESALQAAVAITPVSVAIDASHMSFQFYSSGVYNEPACSTTELDHGVLAIGYGTSGSKPYWLVKNSWGDSWGLSGYIQMTRNKDNQCGIATEASYPII